MVDLCYNICDTLLLLEKEGEKMAISSTFEKLWERFEREQRIYDSVMKDDSSPIVEKRTLEIYYSIQTNLSLHNDLSYKVLPTWR